MNEWEYSVIYVSSYPSAITQLNQAGAEGWELAAVVNGYFYLKRPKVEEQARPQMPAKLSKKPSQRKKKQAA